MAEERCLRAALAGLCAYEVFALASGRVPTISRLCRRHRMLEAVLLGALIALGGHTSVRLDWQPPVGAPVPPDHYVVFIYRGTVCTKDTIVASYPRTGAESPWEGGGLERGKTYTAHVVASGPANTHVGPGVYASVTFETG